MASSKFQLAATLLALMLSLSAISRAAPPPVHTFDCKNCHIPSLSVQQLGAGNVCLSCHDKTVGMVLSDGTTGTTVSAFSMIDASNALGNNPGTLASKGQTSHNWGAPDAQPRAGAVAPSSSAYPQFYSRFGSSTGKVTCSRCHNPHADRANPQLLVTGAGSAQQMCLACHVPWNQGSGKTNITHPVGIDYAAASAAHPGKYAEPPPEDDGNLHSSGQISLFGGKILCGSCHQVHFADSDASTADTPANFATLSLNGGDGKLLRADGVGRADKSALCRTCHAYQVHGDATGERVGCLVCHGGHADNMVAPNYYMLRKNATTTTFGTISGLDYSSPAVLDSGLKYTFWNDRTDGSASGYCEKCHGDAKTIGTGAGSYHIAAAICTDCHSHASGTFDHAGGSGGGSCEACHGHDAGYEYASGQFSQGKGSATSHSTHTENDTDDRRGPNVGCDACHDVTAFPFFRSGADGDGDGRYSLAETDVCDACHSPGGSYDGVNDATVGAKTNWDSAVYAGNSLPAGRETWCVTCHDEVPAVIGTETAPNQVGDNASFGFYVTGHGRAAVYPRMSWQETTASGNPGAARNCGDCHDTALDHISPALQNNRLRSGYANDQGNSNCSNCHSAGGSADAAPRFYTISADYEQSSHSDTLCTDCHDVHGASGNHPAMTRGNQESLCFQCHTAGMVANIAISGAEVADDIEAAFSFSDNSRHSLGDGFDLDGGSYTLECVSCHNVHLVTGQYWQADKDKSPVTRISTPSAPQRNLEVWGDGAGEKMSDYGGTYRKPTGDLFDADQLPNYNSFCQECHEPMPDPAAQAGSHGALNYNADPHGLNSANAPNGGGTCPDWFACGMATGWDGDDCIGNQATCWPVMTRGKGDQLWSRAPFDHAERIAGANFVLSCTDCHEAHGSPIRSMIRTNPNGGTGTTIWNSMCNNCHSYYSDWHAGMACGNASCHVSSRMAQTGTDSLHRMSNAFGTGATRTFNPDLVLHYAFENNLNDSGDWRLHGKWMDNLAGGYAGGRFGQAAVFSGSDNVQVGTRNDYWSTDEGRHATWKYTEMKYNTTLEAWVHPTDNTRTEHAIYTRHTGYANGGYGFSLKKINGALRAVFNIQADSNAGSQGGAAGVRGAYSAVTIPLNSWTHVAATFDTGGPDRDAGDPSIGRIRIFVNGEDVTTSDSGGDNMQPGSGETSIFAYSENSPWNEAICYDGTWCASEFSIGGFYGWQNSFVGRIDEAKVWNTTKDPAYFAAVDPQSPPRISTVEGLIGTNQLTVRFSEGVYGNTGQTGALLPGDIILTDANADNPRSIVAVNHTAGANTAILTMSQPLSAADVNSDTLAASAAAVFDDFDNAADSGAVVIGLASTCPSVPIVVDLNESPGSNFVMDSQGILYGAVNGVGTLTGSAFSADGGGANMILFDYNATCLQADRKMTIEARIKPSGIGTATYITRILARDGDGNYQLSVWRNNTWTNYHAPDNTASIALWTYPQPTVGNTWKPVLTDYDACPVVNGHWYYIKAVWDSDRTGSMPGRIYLDDQGADGADSGEYWSGLIDCTNINQSYNDPATQIINEGDTLKKADGSFAIGTNRSTPGNNNFNGLIDWIIWRDNVD